MKKKPASQSAFFSLRVLIGLAFCAIGLLLALVAFGLYPGGKAFAKQNQSGVPGLEAAPTFRELPTASSGPAGVYPTGVKPTPTFPAVVLYDQLDNPGTVPISSQDFEAANDAFDDFAADDFVVPAGQVWSVTEVDAQGVYFNGPGPADSFNVFFYQDSGGLPGTEVHTATGQAYINNAGGFQVTLSPAAVLAAGTYWVSVQAKMSFDPNGQWGWIDRTMQANSPAAWQNPGNGFGVCPTWGVRQVCAMSPAGEPDQMFRLVGTSAPTPWKAVGMGNPLPAGTFLDTCLLLTDGTAMCHEANSESWHRLKPDINGSYQNGSWDVAGFTVANMAAGYKPLYFASAVLPDGRVVVIGGEYINGVAVWSNQGYVYDPVANAPAGGTWSAQITVPAGWAGGGGMGTIGDAQCTVLQNGTMLLARVLPVGVLQVPPQPPTTDIAAFNPATLTFTALAPAGKGDDNDEENWHILPNGKVLTVQAWIQQRSQVYDPAANAWAAAVNTQVNLADTGAGTANSHEAGPGVLRPDGKLIYFSATSTGRNGVYDTATGTWAATGGAGDFPAGPGGSHYAVADGPASLLPNGNVLVMASPVTNLACGNPPPPPPPMCGVFNKPSRFYEFDGINLKQVAASPNAASFVAYQGRMLLLPSGEVLLTAYNQGAALFELPPGARTGQRVKTPTANVQDVVVYSNGGAPQNAWRPVITDAPATVNGGITYRISGKLFNGFSEGAFFGDDAAMSTNYPLVRIRNQATGHVFYARTHNHSRMGVELVTSNEIITTLFDVPLDIETGPSELVVVANGIPSQPIVITAAPAIDHFKAYKVSPTPPPLNEPVMLQDQFDPALENRIVLDPFRFANPVQKDRAGTITPITNPSSHLKLYNLNPVPSPTPRTVLVANQFGEQTLTVQGSKLLAVPTQKNGSGIVHDLDHFKCYDCTGNPVNVIVNLTDQFHFEPQVLVLQPRYLCNPVIKFHNNVTTPILYPDAHLVLYAINQQPPFNTTVNTLNQFGPEFNLPLQEADLLAVPSSKYFPTAPIVVSAASRLTHGAQGDFEINLPILPMGVTAGAGIECRRGGGAGQDTYTIVANFSSATAPAGISNLTVDCGAVAAPVQGANPNQLLFVVSGACETIGAAPQYVAIHFTVAGTPVWITWGHLYGDTNGNAIVNAGDAAQTKSRAGQVADGTNFRSDVNTDGVINAGDTSAVKSRAGTSLP